ncbi:MAG: hypothetical protein IT429_15875 [Gemmataceae bacterium]|nr:hypothetical protein [Gemmataceae bacterium]
MPEPSPAMLLAALALLGLRRR